MVLIIHITIAILGIFQSTALFFSPTNFKYKISYSLIGLTFLSGTYLAFESNTSLVRSCSSGLVYLSLVSMLIYFSKLKLARQADSK